MRSRHGNIFYVDEAGVLMPAAPPLLGPPPSQIDRRAYNPGLTVLYNTKVMPALT